VLEGPSIVTRDLLVPPALTVMIELDDPAVRWLPRRPGGITLRLPPNLRHKYSDLASQLLGEIVTRW
jgi:CubicO group peptidase (beta-lactamase class C family)